MLPQMKKTYNYIGMSSPPLRLWVANHALSFKRDTNQTELSGLVKELENKGVDYNLKYKILERHPSYTPESKRCPLCIGEIYNIIYLGLENLINKKTEVVHKYRHKTKYKLGSMAPD